ncbi:MAG: hypothetical protein ACI9XR_002250 [Flavobacterium sp.]|jgi:hypothetical protein
MMQVLSTNLIRAFYQGEINIPFEKNNVGNCAAIALIKASIEVFGLNNVIDYYCSNGVYFVTLKNGVKLNFTQFDLNRSNYVANFQFKPVDPTTYSLFNSIYQYAQLLMCTMAVVVAKEGLNSKIIGEFENALEVLNDGPNPKYLPTLLGLEEFCIGNTWKERFLMKSDTGQIAWFNRHTVFMSKKEFDLFGSVGHFLHRFPNRIKISTNRKTLVRS